MSNVPPSKNPLAAALQAIGDDGIANTLGTIDFKVLHREGNKALIAGALLNHEGQRIGMVTIDGFPLDEIQAGRGPGRPRADEKRMAIFLAWALFRAQVGKTGGVAEADRRLVASKLFRTGCANTRVARDIRNDFAKSLAINLEDAAIWVADETVDSGGLPACSILIEKPTYYLTPTGGLEILGVGVVWTKDMGERVISGKVVSVVVEKIAPPPVLSELRATGGPRIISFFRPGQ